MRKKISVVVPCYNEQAALPLFFERMKEVTDKIDADFEYILVDDGSKDDTWGMITYWVNQLDNVRAISFSRNFGKDAAVLAGLRESDGDYVCTMDADLQDPPSLLPEMFQTLEQEDYDVAAARRVNRKGEPPVRSALSDTFYRLMGKASVDMPKGARDFRLMKAKVVDAILQMGEYNRFTKGIFGWVGFRTKWLEYENAARAAGKTKYSMKKLFGYALDGIFGFTAMPVRALYMAALFLGAAALGMLITMLVQICAPSIPFNDLFLILFCVFFTGCVVLCGLAVAVNYLYRILSEVRCRPPYLIARRLNSVPRMPEPEPEPELPPEEDLPPEKPRLF